MSSSYVGTFASGDISIHPVLENSLNTQAFAASAAKFTLGTGFAHDVCRAANGAGDADRGRHSRRNPRQPRAAADDEALRPARGRDFTR